MKTPLPLPLQDKSGWPWQPAPGVLAGPGSDWPRICVVIPSFNQGAFLEAALRSVLLQNYPNLDFRVMDGGSSDESLSILERYSPWLTGWVSEPDGGQSAAINRGWREGKGEILAYLNSDDLYLPGALWKVAEAARQFPQAAFWIGETQVCDIDLNPVGLLRPRIPATPCDLTLVNRQRWAFPQQSSFWRRSVLGQTGFLREELHYVMDRELFYRVCRIATGQVISVNQPLAISRIQPQAKSIHNLLDLYREDKAALLMQSDGKWPNDLYRRWQARRFLGFGYLRLAQKHLPHNRSLALFYFWAAAWQDPQRLLSRSFYGELSRLLRPFHP